MDPLLGVVVSGRYKILRRIGEGGMGIVYEAEHVVIEKRVALKVLRDDFSRRPELVERFRQEARSASRIGHENIVDISDFGETPSGANYFVMEMLNGEDLAMLLAREGSLNPEFAVSVVLQCCKGLGAAHAKGIVHRDMKPENIFLIEREGRRDVVKLVDFGIAKMSDVETPGAPGRKLTKTGMIFGTPEYMSPEQASGKSLDHRVDIYALGVILYELLSGRVPFVGDTFMGVLTQHMFEEPPKLRDINPKAIVPAALESVVRKALAKDPNQRYQTMHEMAVAIQYAMGMELSSPGDSVSRGGTNGLSSVTGARSAGRVSRVTSGRYALADTTYMTSVRPRARNWWIAGSLMGLLILAAVAWAVVTPTERSHGSQRHEAQTAAATAKTTQEPPPAVVPSAATPAAPKQAASQAFTADVNVTVVTQPPGAEVEIAGRGVVCEPTPCSFRTPVKESITLRATRENASAMHELKPDADSFVTLQLRVPSRRRGAKRKDAVNDRAPQTKTSPGVPTEPTPPPPRSSGDLKIPDIFR